MLIGLVKKVKTKWHLWLPFPNLLKLLLYSNTHTLTAWLCFSIVYGHHWGASGGLHAAICLNGNLYKNGQFLSPLGIRLVLQGGKKRWSPLVIKMPKIWRSKTTDRYSPHKEIFHYGRKFTFVSACSMNLDHKIWHNLKTCKESLKMSQLSNHIIFLKLL